MHEPVVSSGDVVGGRYRVEDQLGEGGMGAVWSVIDVETGKPYALKVVLDATGEHVKRFEREVKAMMMLESPHVVKVISVGAISDKIPFMVMERLLGQTLKTIGPQNEQVVADLFMQACEGLAHAHALGIVHRDVKSSNLFVLDGLARDLKVLDFGIARATSYETYEQTMTVTDSAALLGSPQYVSPEQLQSPSNVDERADIWSLGVTMYYALTGELPFTGTSLAEILVSVMSKPIPSLAGKASPDFIAIVQRCLDRKVDHRYRRVSELADDLAAFATVPRALLAPKIRQILSKAAPIVAAIQTPRVSDGTLSLDTAITAAGSMPPRISLPVPPAKKRSLLVPIAFGLGLMLTVGGGAAFVLKHRAAPVAVPEEAAASVAAAVVSSSPPAASSAPPADSAEPDDSLELVADAPITRVIKPNSHRVELEDGKAIITVEDFKSDVAVEVELANGGRARGVAHAGAHSLKLTTAKASPHPHSTGRPPASNSELHKNPY